MSDRKKKIPDNEAIHFLHDLLNHTHGLKLFLEAKENNVQGIGRESLELIYNEIQALENQIAFQFDKLTTKTKSFSAQDLKNFLVQQFELYDLNHSISYNEQSDFITQEVDLPLFERMIKNIVKNIFLWSNKGDIKVELSQDQESIDIHFTNNISREFSEQDPSNGIGLHSLKSLAQKQAMAYQAWIEDGKWHTLIRIKSLGQSKLKDAC